MSHQQHSSSDLSQPQDKTYFIQVLRNQQKIEEYQQAMEKLNAHSAQMQQILRAIEDEERNTT
jgi:hypothetical protein